MEARTGSEVVKPMPKQEVKSDPDAASTAAATASSLLGVKDEEPESEYGKVDRSLPEANTTEDMFEDVDGEDEVEYVDLTYEGIAHVDGVRHFVCEGFKIRQIPEPFIVKRSLLHLHQCIGSGAIVLDPDYQREVVWDEGRAALLITSILMGYFIPPIIFNVKKTVVKVEGREQEKYTRICVDGKQRLTSVWKFMTGQIGIFDSNTPQRKWYYSHPIVNGYEVASNHNILPQAVKTFFQNQFFCCYEYDELTQETEETMFQLVQRGVALTPAEKMRAMSTEWAVFAKQYEDDYSLIVNLSKQNRASGFRLVLTIFTMVQEVMATGRKKRTANKEGPTLQASPQALLRILGEKAPINPALKLKLKVIFDRYEGLIKLCSNQVTATRFKVKMNSVFDPSPDYLMKSSDVSHVRTFSPLELIVTAILVTVHMDHRTDEDLLDDIKEMRRYLRVHHKDLRVNAQCWATSWNYITDVMDRRRGIKPDGPEGTALRLSIESGAKRVLSTATGSSSQDEPSSQSSSPLSSARSSPTEPGTDDELEFPGLAQGIKSSRSVSSNLPGKSNGMTARQTKSSEDGPKRARPSKDKTGPAPKKSKNGVSTTFH